MKFFYLLSFIVIIFSCSTHRVRSKTFCIVVNESDEFLETEGADIFNGYSLNFIRGRNNHNLIIKILDDSVSCKLYIDNVEFADNSDIENELSFLKLNLLSGLENKFVQDNYNYTPDMPVFLFSSFNSSKFVLRYQSFSFTPTNLCEESLRKLGHTNFEIIQKIFLIYQKLLEKYRNSS